MQEPSALSRSLPAGARPARLRAGALPLAGVVACAFLLFGASLARAQVHDNAGKFSKDAIEQAEQTIKEIKDKHRHELLVETYPAIPDSMQDDFRAKGKERFFEDWANDRFKAEGIDGVVVLICMDPRRLQIAVGNETQKKLFTPADRDELKKNLAAVLREEKFDEALTRTANFVLKKFDQHDPRDTGATNSGLGAGNYTPPANSTPAYTPPSYNYNSTPRATTCGTGGIQTFVCLFVGVIILIALLRLVFRNSGGGYGGGYGGGGYGGGGVGGGGYGGGGGYNAPPPPPQGGYGGGYAGGYGPGYAPPSRGSGFGSGLLGGLLGGAVGGYAADRLMHRNDTPGGGTYVPPTGGGGGGYSPPAPADSGGTFTPDTSSSGGGADFGSSPSPSPSDPGGGADFGPSSSGGGSDFGSSGSDFGSSDSGGGGGSDFGGGGGGDSGSSGGSDF